MTRRMDWVAFAHWLKVIVAVLNLTLLVIFINDAVLAEGPVNKRQIVSLAIGIILLTAGLAYLTTHPLTESNVYGAPQSGAAADSS